MGTGQSRPFPEQVAILADMNGAPGHGPDDQAVADAKGFPKTIYSLWLQGAQHAPELVQANFARWEELNPEYQLQVLEQSDVDSLLQHVPWDARKLPHAALSDLVRLELLHKTGGIWVDATVLPTAPLSRWISDVACQAGFFAFDRPGPDRPLASWFLAATPDNPVIEKWRSEAHRFWQEYAGGPALYAIPENPAQSVAPGWGGKGEQQSKAKGFPYFWVHYLFAYLLETDQSFAAQWNKSARLPAEQPHLLQRALEKAPNLPSEQLEQILGASPVHKLNRRKPLHPSVLRKAYNYDGEQGVPSLSATEQVAHRAQWIAGLTKARLKKLRRRLPV